METKQEQLKVYERIVAWLATSRYIVPFLFFLGLLRTAFSFLAYAPADGADGMKYHLYAAYISGIPLNDLVSELSPLYPYFIYLHRYVLGNFELILVTQFLMSSLIGVIYFLALRRYHAGLAFIIALAIIGDMQTSLNFNFVATEPLYITLIASAFAFSMQLSKDSSLKEGLIFAILTGISVGLLSHTRTVGSYVIVPIAVLATLKTRRWQQILALLIAYALTSFLFVGILRLNGAEQKGSANQVMYFNFLNRMQALAPDRPAPTDVPIVVSPTAIATDIVVTPEATGIVEIRDAVSPTNTVVVLPTNAPETGTDELRDAIDACGDSRSSSTTLIDCMQEELGGQGEFTSTIQQAYIETILEDSSVFITLMYDNVTAFLKMSGHQFFERDGLPAEAQCNDLDGRHQRALDFFTLLWADANMTQTEYEALDSTTWDFIQQMCPPSKTIPEFQDLAWYISFRYRSISRPNPYLWYGLLLALITIVPWMRKLWYPIMMAGGLLFYHAVVSAVAINVQPRYVVVTNPFKIILVVSLIVLVIQQVIIMASKLSTKSEGKE